MCIRDSLCGTQPNYVVQITGDNPEGKRELDNFIAVSYTHLDVYKRQNADSRFCGVAAAKPPRRYP